MKHHLIWINNWSSKFYGDLIEKLESKLKKSQSRLKGLKNYDAPRRYEITNVQPKDEYIELDCLCEITRVVENTYRSQSSLVSVYFDTREDRIVIDRKTGLVKGSYYPLVLATAKECHLLLKSGKVGKEESPYLRKSITNDKLREILTIDPYVDSGRKKKETSFSWKVREVTWLESEDPTKIVTLRYRLHIDFDDIAELSFKTKKIRKLVAITPAYRPEIEKVESSSSESEEERIRELRLIIQPDPISFKISGTSENVENKLMKEIISRIESEPSKKPDFEGLESAFHKQMEQSLLSQYIAES